MTREELIERLKGYEWEDVEFKRAQRGVPEDVYSTVSAFANTGGGWLIFGVRQAGNQLEVAGVEDVDKVQNDFLSSLRTAGKLSRAIDARGELHNLDGKTVLVFRIPELPRTEKPVYLKGDIRQSYIRRGGGDERCTPREIERFLRDAADQPFDGKVLPDLDPESFYDEPTLAWYRRRFDEREPGRHETLSDRDFLLEWGFVVEVEGKKAVTRAGTLLFGKGRHVRQCLPRPVVDFQLILEKYDVWNPERRWADRVVVEGNIIQAWLTIVERYMKIAERPFELDATTLRRHDEPPDYISFREAAINLLIHQDYGDMGRHAQIQIFRDRSRFWNPGDAFGSFDQLLEPGAKEVRNPNIVGAFRRIGLSDQAGTGIRAIFRNWRQLGNVPPQMLNKRDEKAFELTLLKEPLLSANQKRFQTELGVHLSDREAEVFAFACLRERLTLTDARAVGASSASEAAEVLDHLVLQRLLEPLEEGRVYTVASHLRQRYLATLAAEEAESRPSGGRVEADSLAFRVISILSERPLGKAELAAALGLKTVSGQLNKVVRELIDRNLIAYTVPEKPQSRLQKYRLTKSGCKLLGDRRP